MSNLNSDDYYQILGCPKNADEAALKKAYRKLAVKWHPDKNPDNPQAKTNFQKISEAYAVLSDPEKRKAYDMYGTQGVQAQEAGADMSGGGPRSSGGGFPPGANPFGGFGGAGGPHTTFHFSTGGPGGFSPGGGGMGGSMSAEDAEAFFASFFGHDDPFGSFTRRSSAFPSSKASIRPGSQFGGSAASPFASDPFGLRGGPMGGGGFPMSSTGGIPTQRAPRQKRYDAIPDGTVVSLKGLVNKPERNGDRGEILDYDPTSGRYTVLIEDSDEQIKVKPHNLLQHIHVKIDGVESQPELNGLRGTIIAWNDVKQRYNIYVMDRSKVVGLKPGNVILEPGTVGMIVGLSAKPELNGRYGRINAWIRDAHRYEVQLSKDQIVRVKVENLRV